MAKIKHQVFISSTYDDLKESREQCIKAILEMGNIPVGMEMFSAGDEQQWEIIKRHIDESDYYIVIIAHRYGSMDGEISYTEKEYNYATSKNIPVLGFVIDETAVWPIELHENNKDIHKRLQAFKVRVCGKMVSMWQTPNDLYGKCSIALMKAISTYPRLGWVRAEDDNARDMMISELTRLSSENAKLRKVIEESETSKKESKDDEVHQVLDALRINQRRIYSWDDEKNEWIISKESNLLKIFEIMSHDLLDEASNDTINSSIGLELGAKSNRRGYSVPTNHVKSYISDLISLGLVQQTPKRHSVNDRRSYWSLTELGRSAHSLIRKNELLRGLAAGQDEPDTPESDEN